MQEKSFCQEQDEVLEQFLLKDIYSTFVKDKASKGTKIELMITSDCNKDCEYCYLQKHKDFLYPKDIRNHEQILKNLELYLKFLLKNRIEVGEIQLFSGEIWGSDFSFEIFDMLLKYDIQKITHHILIPSNCSFVNDEVKVKKIEEYCIKFFVQGVRLGFSVSYDGAIVEKENRPFTLNQDYDEEVYANKIFDFVDTIKTGFHPMIAACTIEKQIENFDWWVKKCKEKNWDPIFQVMLLEVRNDDWDKEKITHYVKWLNHIVSYTYDNLIDRDSNKMIRALIGEEEGFLNNYIPFVLRLNTQISCNLIHHHIVRLGDLAIVPCHRLAYDKLLYGKYKVENDEIVGVKALNLNFAFQNLLLNNNGYLKCDRCLIKNVCPGQCHGSAFESTKESFYPIECVCDLEKAKFCYLLLYLEKMVRNTDFSSNKFNENNIYRTTINKYLNILNEIRVSKEYEEWITLAETILFSV